MVPPRPAGNSGAGDAWQAKATPNASARRPWHAYPKGMPADIQILNGDMARRVVVDTGAMAWSPSPGRGVWRKRLHMVGGAESAQVTSLVRYQPGSSFPAHDHPEGEEILVLEGVFSDKRGDWPAGTHLLNPEGFRHAPFSREGCVLFVKLRQYAGRGRETRETDTRALAWEPTEWTGVEVKVLDAAPGFPDETRLERWAAGASVDRAVPGGVEIFVLGGGIQEGGIACEVGTWLRLPDGARFEARSPAGCLLYLKCGALPSLRSGTAPAGLPRRE